MQANVVNINGQVVNTIDLPADIFEIEVNVGLMHQAYVRQLANARQGTHSTLDRSEINRTKAKWYRQKGTGRARHGARSAPQFVGGGVAHGPHPRDYTQQMPRKMRQKAIRCALSALARDGQLVFVDRLAVEAAKTSQMQETIRTLTGGDSALVLLASRDEAVERSVRNLPKAKYLRASYLNIRDLLQYDKVIVPLDALALIQQLWGAKEEV